MVTPNWWRIGASSNQVPFLVKETDTKKYAAEQNLNTQLAARKIRYDWWDQLHTR